ncbi:MAG: OmpA family protein [Saprospiraceae bacterium]|nr:OmpA family protein [Saprospiraceae bacterium]MCB0623175.1 OmpA family protein [Saprospiraceae bacterium]MCB0675689.1 OmpA family protein [Saprospiraceae bacterium]MCB0683102.1 OmpA family protein [Saprospiraceae bacterium]
MNRLLLFLSLVGLSLSACVSTKQYQALEDERNQYQDEANALRPMVDENRVIREDLKECKAQLRGSILENENLTVLNDQLRRENEELTQRFNQLLDQNKALLSTASYEKQSLQEVLAAQQEELDRRQREMQSMSTSLNERETNLNELRSSLGNREQRVAELEALLSSKDAQMAQLKSSVDQALKGFSQSDLTVEERDGKLYVSLSQNLLFKSGSDQIDSKGKNAIKQLAVALNQNPDIDIMVEGHTDSDGKPDTNWDLSTSRATSVVKVLTQYGIDPTRITASGRAFYDPVAPNDSSSNKARNRRTEIILSPQLDQLYNILNQ